MSEQKTPAITIRNPLVIQRVMEELSHGTGRNLTEVAENMILEDADRRRMDRVQHIDRPNKRTPHAAAV